MKKLLLMCFFFPLSSYAVELVCIIQKPSGGSYEIEMSVDEYYGGTIKFPRSELPNSYGECDYDGTCKLVFTDNDGEFFKGEFDFNFFNTGNKYSINRKTGLIKLEYGKTVETGSCSEASEEYKF